MLKLVPLAPPVPGPPGPEARRVGVALEGSRADGGLHLTRQLTQLPIKLIEKQGNSHGRPPRPGPTTGSAGPADPTPEESPMGVVLHWFLPTNGDSRTDLSLGNAVGAAGSRAGGRGRQRAGAGHRLHRPDRPVRGAARLHRRADPDQLVVRGRVDHDRRADPGHREVQVPGRVPARPDVAHAGRAHGRDLPAHLRRPPAAQRGHRRRRRGAAAVRRPPRQGRPGTSGPGSSCTSSANCGAATR